MMTVSEYISFPGLNWVFEVDPVLAEFSLFGLPISIRWYGVMIALGFLLAVLYALRFAKPRFGIELDPMTDAVLVATVFAVLGDRVYYILFYDGISTFWEDPLKVFRIWDGGLAIYGAVIGAFVTGIWMCKLKKLPLFAMFDLASIGFFIGQCLGRWGNFFNQEAFGGNTTLPWGMSGSIIQRGSNGAGYDPTLPVHPTFLYESLWCLAGFILLHILSKKAYTFKGKLFSVYVIWYGLGRFWIEGLRTDSLMLGAMRVSQLLAAVCVLGGATLYCILKHRADRLPKTLPAQEAQNGETD
jgi:phosphatidylglycerol:prolipoprotein diacylglycerol transferase